jgi:hypothetical protein
MLSGLHSLGTTMRGLFRVVDGKLFACAVNRRDFVRVSDGKMWAHESHKWLVAADTGVALAHRTGHIYYRAEDGVPLYYETSEALAADTATIGDRTVGSHGVVDRLAPK